MNPVNTIIALNIIIFLLSYIFPEIARNLAVYAGSAFADRPWGIFTAMFVHTGIFHLLANMVTLYFFGSFTLRILGTGKFLLVYLAGGIIGNALFAILAATGYSAIGASGAVFALGGVLTILVPYLRVFIFPIPAPIPLWIAVIGGFVLLLFVTGIAWQAHLGGLATGMVAGLLLRREHHRYYF